MGIRNGISLDLHLATWNVVVVIFILNSMAGDSDERGRRGEGVLGQVSTQRASLERGLTLRLSGAASRLLNNVPLKHSTVPRALSLPPQNPSTSS